MKTKYLFIFGLVVVFVVSACKGKPKDETLPLGEAGETRVTKFAPLPSFKTVFAASDQLEVRDLSASVPKHLYKVKQDPPRHSFALGVLTADAVIAARGRNKTKLMAIANEMMRITTLLNLEAEVSQLGDDIKNLVEQDKWDELEQSLDKHKKVVEDKLWEREEFDQYTLMVLGGWTEAVNSVSWLINLNYSAERTKVLTHKGIWNDIHYNMQLIKSPAIVNEIYYQSVIDLIATVKEILDADSDGIYSKAQTDEIFKQTDLIKSEFQK